MGTVGRGGGFGIGIGALAPISLLL